MILKTSILLVSIIASINSTYGASFSKVFVQSGQEVVPVEYVQYGSPSVPFTGPQIAQLSAGPVSSVIPIPPNLPPCGTPCVYPGQAIGTLGPIAQPNANYITYNSPIPNVPVLVTPNKDLPTGYEYSYTVYDESTGDHKQQRELSDGSVVRGEYSYLQPDGYIQEVQYVADDLKGFNAVVKKFLPANTEESKKVKQSESKDPAPPCHEVKNEPLKIEPESNVDNNEKVSEHHEISSEEKHSDSPSEEEEPQEDHKEPAQEESQDVQTKESSQKTHNVEPSHEQHIEIVSPENHNEEPSHEDQKEILSNEHHEEVSIENHNEESPEEGHLEASGEHQIAHANVLVPYNDIIRCVQAAINGAKETSTAHKPESPLTYIVLNKPC